MILGRPRIHLSRCGSTNDELAARAAGATTGTAIVAGEQTAGRGRGDHRWHSPPGNLYASLLVRPAIAPAQVPAIALVAGVAVARALRRWGVSAQLKWPNDVVCGAKKIAGILSESASRGAGLEHAIVGVGVNIAPLDGAPPELANVATSLAAERPATGDPLPSPDDVLDAICEELAGPLAAFEAGGVAVIRDAWEALWRDRGRRGRAEIHGRVVEGEVIGITADGHLELALDSGERVAAVAGAVDIH